jgi:hypothetical protein
MTATVDPGKRLALLLILLGLVGCGGGRKQGELNPTEQRLWTIGKAYVEACNGLGRAPTNFAEIKPYVEGEVSDDLLRSPNDGEPFVILWGVDYNRLPYRKDNPFTVGGYEKNGVHGTRYVLRFPMGVVSMTDDDLRKAIFPPGHSPPP